MNQYKDYLIISNIKIHNANALSSPYSIGFPAMTAWLGFMHALQRKLQATAFKEVKFTGIIPSCHDFILHTYKGKSDFVSSLIVTSNPLTKTGARPSFIEEARCDIEITLAIECDMGVINYDEFEQCIEKKLHTLKIASGDIISFEGIKHIEVENSKPNELTKHLMPCYCLVTRQDLVKKEMQEGKDAIDAMLEYLQTTTDIKVDDKHKVTRSSSRKEKGWIVPIAIGYQGISKLGQIKNSRDETTPHRFAESVVTLGEFKMPYHFDTIEEMVWRYKEYKGDDLYLSQNNYSINSKESKI